MGLVARAAIPGPGFDTSTKLTSTQGIRLHEAGYRWCARYVRLPHNSSLNDIDASELEYLTTIGLEVLLIQHVRTPPWDPREHSAFADAMAAVDHAKGAHYPDGAHLFLDCEGITQEVTADACKDFVERWAAQVRGEGYQAGIYVGYDVPMNPMQLWLLHGVNSYWKDPGPREVNIRGFSVQQMAPEKTVAGVRIDEDEIVTDLLGDTPTVAVWLE